MSEQQRNNRYQPTGAPRRRSLRQTHSLPLRSPARRRDNAQPPVINSRDVRLSNGAGGLPLDQVGNLLIAKVALDDSSLYEHERTLRNNMALGPKSRHARQQQRQRRRRQIITLVVTLCLMAVFGCGIFWMQRSNNLARAATENQTPTSAPTTVTASAEATANASMETTGLPTPVLATFQGVALHLSVRMADFTEVAFHPASNPYAMVLDTTLTPDSADAVRAAGGTGRDKSKQPTGDDAPLIGSYIQMWRTDTGSIPGRTAMDEGAPAGSVTYAPIDGTVTAVREYNYEHGCKDFEVHISFTDPALARYEVVMIHEENVRVKVGDAVVGGVTPIAVVRDLTPFLTNQLGEYTGEAGNHAHVQVNDTQATSYISRMKYRESTGYYLN